MRLLPLVSILLLGTVALAPLAAAHPIHDDCRGFEIWVGAFLENPRPDGGLVCYGKLDSLHDNICHSGEISSVLPEFC